MPDNSSSNKRLAKNSLFLSIRMVIVLGISLYTTRVVLKVLGVEDYGVYSVVAGFVSMFAFVNSSMASATQRYYNFELGKNGLEGANRVYVTSLCIHIILAIVTIAVTIPIGIWYVNNKMVIPVSRIVAAEWIFYFSVLSLFVDMVCVPYTAAVMAHEKMNFYAILSVIDAVLKLAMVFLLQLINGDKLIYYGLFFLVISISHFVLYYFYCKKEFDEIRIKNVFTKDLFKSMLSFSGWSLFGSLAYMLREQGVNLVLNFFYGTVVNAAKGVANQVNAALQGFITNLTVPAKPQVIQSYANDNINRTWRLTFSVSKLTTLFFYMMALPVSIEVNYILSLWLGDSVPEHTKWFLIIMLLTNTFGCLVAPISTVMHATGKIKFYQILSSTSNLFSVPLAFLFIRLSKTPEMAFVALFITMVTNILAGLISSHKYASLSYRDYLKKVLNPIFIVMIITVPISFIPYILLEESFIRLVITIAIAVLSISILSFFLAMDKGEKKMVTQFVIKIVRKWKK